MQTDPSKNPLKTSPENWISTGLQIQVPQDFTSTLQDLKINSAKSVILTKYLGHLPSQFQNQSLILNLQIQSSSTCLQVQGPEKLLKNLPNQTTCPTVQADPKTLLSHSSDHKPPSWCQNPGDLNLNLNFHMESQHPDLTMYVTPADKELIHLHLMVTSVFLFAILAAVIIGFLIRTVTNRRKEHVILSQIDDQDNV